MSVLLAQLCERYHKARKEDGQPMLAMTELAQVHGTLPAGRARMRKLHALAATAAAMIDEAYEAFETEHRPGISPCFATSTRRRYRCRSATGRSGSDNRRLKIPMKAFMLRAEKSRSVIE